MTPRSVDRLRASFEAMSPRLDAMTEHFYAHLFEIRPDVRPLFQVDMDMQRRHLAAALALIVRNITILDALEEPLRELGARHARVGVLPEHYPVVADAMLFAMTETLKDDWTAEVADAWTELLLRVARTMMAGGAGIAPVTRP